MKPRISEMMERIAALERFCEQVPLVYQIPTDTNVHGYAKPKYDSGSMTWTLAGTEIVTPDGWVMAGCFGNSVTGTRDVEMLTINGCAAFIKHSDGTYDIALSAHLAYWWSNDWDDAPGSDAKTDHGGDEAIDIADDTWHTMAWQNGSGVGAVVKAKYSPDYEHLIIDIDHNQAQPPWENNNNHGMLWGPMATT